VQEPEADVEAVAAALRADRADTDVFLEVLAAKLEDALPGFAEVRRSGGRFGRGRHVESLRVEVGERCFRLDRSGTAVRAEVEHRVRGVRLSGQQTGIDEWLAALAGALTEAAATESRAREALGRLLT
jgi:hypothetical protein